MESQFNHPGNMHRLRPCHDHACFGRNGLQPEWFGPLWEDVQLDLRVL